ncbi:MAG: tRNA uridine-5-carboxymethylaminomethyl(34) synthesis GTPase MnmE [Nevskia sp.]|nr:tRNA uridine-5-carboxymethylaminomethyl(34) synthesis GTPase MnmE [Nevskia sp.]
MNATEPDTIAAIATAPGRGAVGILRVSGPHALAVAAAMCGALPPPRQAQLRRFRDEGGEAIDEGLVLVFPGPDSYTGEDVVELQGHGGPVVLDLLLRAACAAGARLARPGEFSERAFLNGRLDLVQAEAVADLIDAASRGAAAAALRSLQGEFSRRVDGLLDELVALRADLEASLDFADEEDVPWLTPQALQARTHAVAALTDTLLADAAQGRRLREGMTVAIAGRPNVGKSTLLNRLAGTEAAIVSPQAGTTRDLLREHIDLDGLPLTLVDTAGLRDAADPVEQEGVRRAWAALEKAELVLFVVDDCAGITAADTALLQRLPEGIDTLIVLNKCDLSGHAPVVEAAPDGRASLRLSAATGAGMDLLADQIREVAGLSRTAEGLFTARARHLEALQRARETLRRACAVADVSAGAELLAEELRLAQQALDEITGRFTAEDLLGRIFSSFCIGK